MTVKRKSELNKWQWQQQQAVKNDYCSQCYCHHPREIPYLNGSEAEASPQSKVTTIGLHLLIQEAEPPTLRSTAGAGERVENENKTGGRNEQY
jgi:hypothetical protein